jgi:hypothetical protein
MADVDVNTQDFIAGLKTIIRTSWPSQEKFAQGVTSKVNMSNILRGAGGTSYAMRKALAEKAGMTIEDITKLGRAPKHIPVINLAAIMPGMTADVPPEDAIPYGGSINEVMNTASDFTFGLHANITHYAKAMLALVKDITTERDKLLDLLAREQMITNTLDESIKLVSREKRVIYVNRAMMEKFHVTPGDQIYHAAEGSLCHLTGHLIDKVCAQGKQVQEIASHSLGPLFITGYPIVDKTWQVTQVLVVVQLGSSWLDLLRESGWALPPSN